MPKRQETRVFKQLAIRFTGQHSPSLIDLSLALYRRIAGPRLLFDGICMIAIHQSEEFLHVTISGEYDFAVTRELLPIGKIRPHEGKITRIEVLPEKVTSFNSGAIGAMFFDLGPSVWRLPYLRGQLQSASLSSLHPICIKLRQAA